MSPLFSLYMAICIVIPVFLKGSLRYLHCSHRTMYCWKRPLFSIQDNPFIRLKCARDTVGLRRIKFSGKDMEVGTEEDILKVGSQENRAPFSTMDRAPGALRTLDREAGAARRREQISLESR